MGLFDIANKLAVLFGGRLPEWTEQLGSSSEIASEQSGAPAAASAGVYLQNSPKTLLWVQLREDVSYQTHWVTITAHGATVYQLDIDGDAISYDSSSGDGAEDTILEGLKAAIEADSPGADDTVTATVGTDPDGNAALVLTGKAGADYTVTPSIGSGSGTISSESDATTADVRVYFYPRQGQVTNNRPAAWVSSPALVWSGLDYHGLVERLDTGGLDRAYVEVSGEDGRVRAWIAPAKVEGQQQ